MAFQFSDAVRNAALDAIESNAGTSCALEIRSGSAPATCATAGTGTVLATINLPSDWMAAASGGSKAKAGTWEDASADATGTAGHFRVYNSQATKDNSTCFIQGTVTATGGGGDMTVANTSIAATQTITITSFTINAGGA
jgi:hypothetical protein